MSKRGKVTEVLIGTVVALGRQVSAEDVYAKLKLEGFPTTIGRVRSRLWSLGKQGRILEVSGNLYEGV